MKALLDKVGAKAWIMRLYHPLLRFISEHFNKGPKTRVPAETPLPQVKIDWNSSLIQSQTLEVQTPLHKTRITNRAFPVCWFLLISAFVSFSWASHTLACFPAPLRQFYQQNPCPQESKQDLRQRVEDEYRRWKCKLLFISQLFHVNPFEIFGLISILGI